MKKTLILLFAIVLFPLACKDRQDLQPANSKSNLTYSDLPKYEHKWIEYKTLEGIKTNLTELYISDFGDTLVFQNIVYENEKIDSTRSDFLDFTASWVNDTTISGRVSVYSRNDHIIKSPLLERKINLQFIQFMNGKKGTVEFNAINKNFVDFEFQNENDSLIGILVDYSQYDTIVNEIESIRIIETKYPLDNKPSTNNIFIQVQDLHNQQNKR